MKKKRWPDWWTWEIELSSHLLKRMQDRGYNEVELRAMLQKADEVRRDIEDGRWIIETMHRRRMWEVVVEPDVDAAVLVVVTAYSV